MRLAILTCATLLIGAGCICAAGGAQAGAMPGPRVNDAGCQAVWTFLSPDGATLSKDEAEPNVVDFTIVDTNSDGAINADEFKTGCQGGWVKFDVEEFEVEGGAISIFRTPLSVNPGTEPSPEAHRPQCPDHTCPGSGGGESGCYRCP